MLDPPLPTIARLRQIGLALHVIGGRIDLGALVVLQLHLEALQSSSSVLFGKVRPLLEAKYFPLQSPADPVPVPAVCGVLPFVRLSLRVRWVGFAYLCLGLFLRFLSSHWGDVESYQQRQEQGH